MRDEDRLERIAEAIADGRPVDWEREQDADPRYRNRLEQLAKLEEVGRALTRLAATQEGPQIVPEAHDGNRISHYRLVEKIGEGGMGVVWKAEDTVLNRTVAIKLLPGDLALDEERRRMFLDEARLAASVSHAHIVQVHELGREGDLDFIVMEYVEGQPLKQQLSGRPLPFDRVVALGTQVAEGMARAHRRGLIHRDLKPANILVTSEGEVKIVDFGLATLFAPPETIATSTLALDEAGSSWTHRQIAGTLPYMSPEQVRGEKLDSRSDIFSFGAILYEMTTGQRPFTGQSPADVASEILRARPRPVHELVPQIPFDLDRIVSKAMARASADRYQSMDDLAVDLRRLGRDLDSGSAPSYKRLGGTSGRSKRVRLIRLALLPVLALATMTWVTVTRLRDARSGVPTLLIQPLEVRSDTDVYLGRAMADGIATSLAQAKDLIVLPVPAFEPGTGPLEPIRQAEMQGAEFVLTGTAFRDGDEVLVTISLVDATRNRVQWGKQMTAPSVALTTVPASLARDVARELGGTLPGFYEKPFTMTGGAALENSPLWTEAKAAVRRGNVDPLSVPQALEASNRVFKAFPGELAVHVLRMEALLHDWYFVRQASERALPKRKLCEDALVALEVLDPNSPYPAIYRAFFSNADGRWEDGLGIYTQVLERHDLAASARAWALMHRAEAKLFLGDVDGAVADTDASIRFDPAYSGTYKFAAGALRGANRLDEALQRIDQAIALDPVDAQQWTVKGRILAGLGRYEEAAAALERECRLVPDQVRCAQIAIFLSRAGKPAEAASAAENAASLTATRIGQYNLACYAALAGKRLDALRHLGQALDLGFANLHIAEDPDLESLRGMPEFEAIVAEVKNRVESK